MAYPSGLKYTKDHEWIQVEGDRGKVGITDYAQQQLGDVVYVELPEKGAVLKAGQPFGTIESVKAVSELYAPISGEVVEVNAALKQKPETVNTDPHGSSSTGFPASSTASHTRSADCGGIMISNPSSPV